MNGDFHPQKHFSEKDKDKAYFTYKWFKYKTQVVTLVEKRRKKEDD